MREHGRFLLVGLGVMGGSYALALKKAGHYVTAVDTDEAAIAWALAHDVIDEGAGSDAAGLVAQADCVVLCIYPKDILAWLEGNRQYLRPGAMVTDLAGVKGCFLPEAQALLGEANEFIACHPMAGREKSGVQNADAAIFRGANFLIVPTARNTEAGIAFARELAAVLGAGQVRELTIAAHDALIGYVSQLTHAIAVSLMVANDSPLLPEVTGDSFRDLTRIADINDALWSELFFANAPALVDEIDSFIATLAALKQAVQEEDGDTLRAMMRQSAARRRAFDRDDTRGK